MTQEAQIEVLKAQRIAHEDRHKALEKYFEDTVDRINRQHESCKAHVTKELEKGHEEFKAVRADVGEIKTKVNLIYANGNGKSLKKEWTIRLTSGGGALAIILFLVQYILMKV